MKVAVPVLETEVKGRRLINAHFGKSNLFAIVDTETGEVKFVKNPANNVQRGRGMQIAQMLKEKGVKAVLVKEIGAGAFDKLKNVAGMEVYLVPTVVKFLDEAVSLFKEGKLTELSEPNEG